MANKDGEPYSSTETENIYVNVLMECYKNQKYTRHQREIKRRIEKQYGGITK